jgi:hypothetical protein
VQVSPQQEHDAVFAVEAVFFTQHEVGLPQQSQLQTVHAQLVPQQAQAAFAVLALASTAVALPPMKANIASAPTIPKIRRRFMILTPIWIRLMTGRPPVADRAVPLPG